jgi:hypothetical protein
VVFNVQHAGFGRRWWRFESSRPDQCEVVELASHLALNQGFGVRTLASQPISDAVVMATARRAGAVDVVIYGHTAIARHFDPKRHRRVVLFTDDQQHDSGSVNLDHVPLIYTFNLAGYRPSGLTAGQRGRYTLGGFTDATFEAMRVLENGSNAGWPF